MMSGIHYTFAVVQGAGERNDADPSHQVFTRVNPARYTSWIV